LCSFLARALLLPRGRAPVTPSRATTAAACQPASSSSNCSSSAAAAAAPAELEQLRRAAAAAAAAPPPQKQQQQRRRWPLLWRLSARRRLFKLRELVDYELQSINTDDNVADIFIKALSTTVAPRSPRQPAR
jgi:hypothetical protein